MSHPWVGRRAEVFRGRHRGQIGEIVRVLDDETPAQVVVRVRAAEGSGVETMRFVVRLSEIRLTQEPSS